MARHSLKLRAQIPGGSNVCRVASTTSTSDCEAPSFSAALPRKAFRHLTVEAVRYIHEAVLAAHSGAPGLRDAVLLESALAAPQASFAGKPLLKTGVGLPAPAILALNDAGGRRN